MTITNNGFLEILVTLNECKFGFLVGKQNNGFSLKSHFPAGLLELEKGENLINELNNKNSDLSNLENLSSYSELNNKLGINSYFHLQIDANNFILLFSGKKNLSSSKSLKELESLLQKNIVENNKETGDEDSFSYQIIKNINAVIFSISAEKEEIFFISPTVERIFGYKKEELQKEKFKILRAIHQADFHKFKELIKNASLGKSGIAEYRFFRKDGKIVYVSHSTFPVIIKDKIERFDGIIYDITSEKHKQILLEQSEERFRTLFETAEDLIFILDNEGKFVSVNSNGALKLDYSPKEMVGKHFLEFIDESDKVSIAKSFHEVLRSNKITTFESTFVSKYGRSVVFEINGRSTKQAGNIAGMLGIGRNVTQRRSYEEKMKELNNKLIEANRLISIERDRAKQQLTILEELNRLKNEFVSNISHELRTPLASIIGFSETIASDPEMPEEMKKEFNSIILSEGKRLAKLINDILDLSKIERGQIELTKVDFDITKVLADVIDTHLPIAKKKDIHLSAQIPEEEIIVFADKERMQQVFTGLINNAIKFTDKGGRIKLIAQNFTTEIEIIVSDTGIGIPEKDIPHIFEKFYRVSRPGTEIPGTGLGLVLVKQIVDLHKGFITVQSEEEKGTTFVIKIPTSPNYRRGNK